MRKKFVAGNWKMFTNAATAEQLAKKVVAGVGSEDSVSVAVCPPFPYLATVGAAVKGSPVGLGAQNMHPDKEGAFTGEVSPTMLVDLDCNYVILGHSERRHRLGEDNSFINKKVIAALEAGLHVILCVGETLDEREANLAEAVFHLQVASALSGVPADKMTHLTIAYEPVWAIGTGKTATPDTAQQSHAFIREHIAKDFGKEVAEKLQILYGGSVKPDNAADLMKEPDVDGALVGGASLKEDQFLAIVKAAL